jgi:hypothetical protein
MSIKKIYTKTIAILDILYVCSIFFFLKTTYYHQKENGTWEVTWRLFKSQKKKVCTNLEVLRYFVSATYFQLYTCEK